MFVAKPKRFQRYHRIDRLNMLGAQLLSKKHSVVGDRLSELFLAIENRTIWLSLKILNWPTAICLEIRIYKLEELKGEKTRSPMSEIRQGELKSSN